ncbi:MAG: polysaccharide deacetylase family protein [Candidatus Paceibacterota bacterium]
MRNFLRKYLKRPLQILGLYGKFHHYFFLLLEQRVSLTNLFYKKFYRTAPILLYHRITTPIQDPIMLCVSPERFESHLIFLKKNYEVIPLRELSKRLIDSKIKGNEAAITFDDGYQDNLSNALPLLEKYNIPATIFITTGHIGEKANFAWDKKYSENDRAVFLNETEIKILSNHPLIEIGAHTVNHPSLAGLEPGEQQKEILNSKKKLEGITGKEIKTFAYPFGGIYDFSEATKKIVRESGFDFAYSNTGLLAIKTKNGFGIPRINIREITPQGLARRLICQIKNF